MSSGVFTVAPYYTDKVILTPDSTCITVLNSLTLFFKNIGAGYYTGYSCTATNVVNGTVIKVAYNGNPYSDLTVTSMTATLNDVQSSTIDFSSLNSVVIVCFFVLLFFFGFHSGVQNGNR